MKCNTCGKEYEVMPGFEDYEQASGCAASLYLHGGDYYILAHYGSRYDMSRYRLSQGDPHKIGHVCDDCIGEMLNDGRAYLIEDGVW